MASIFQRAFSLFGLGGAEKPQSKAEHQMPLTSMREVPGFGDQFGRKEKLAKGQGLGIDPKLLDRSTSSFAKLQDARLKLQQQEIANKASAGTMGRSILPIRQQSYARTESDDKIMDKLINLTIANEQEKIGQQERAEASLTGLIGADANQQNAWRGAQGAEFDRIAGARTARDDAQSLGLSKLASLAATIGGAAMGQPALGVAVGQAIGGYSSSQYQGTQSSIIDWILKNRGASTVAGTGGTFSGNLARAAQDRTLLK